MNIEVVRAWADRVEMLELVDVTAEAFEPKLSIAGWHVKLTQQVWDRYVEGVRGKESPESRERLCNLCSHLWQGLRAVTENTDWVLGGIEFGMGNVNRVVANSAGVRYRLRPPAEVRLTAVAVIGTDGFPTLVVLVPHDHYGRPLLSRIA